MPPLLLPYVIQNVLIRFIYSTTHDESNCLRKRYLLLISHHRGHATLWPMAIKLLRPTIDVYWKLFLKKNRRRWRRTSPRFTRKGGTALNWLIIRRVIKRNWLEKAVLLKAALNKNLVNKLRIVTCFRLSIFSEALFSIAQFFAQPGKLSKFNVYLPISY